MHFFRAEGLEVAPQPLFWCPKSSDAPVSVNINGTDYYYVKNLQGDIIALLDGQGTCMVKYTYDAWGKVLSVEDSTETNIGTINPLRYRGYYYDSDLGFYYLQSRYYDPTVGRFLNADEQFEIENITKNLYIYCNNNCVNRIDPTGKASYSNSYSFNIVTQSYMVLTTILVMRARYKLQYFIKNGIIQFQFDKNKSFITLMVSGVVRTLATAMYYVAKKINNKFLKGRTIGGIERELKLHYWAYKIGPKKLRVNAMQADMGGLWKWNPGYDNNAWFFESYNAIVWITKVTVTSNRPPMSIAWWAIERYF